MWLNRYNYHQFFVLVERYAHWIGLLIVLKHGFYKRRCFWGKLKLFLTDFTPIRFFLNMLFWFNLIFLSIFQSNKVNFKIFNPTSSSFLLFNTRKNNFTATSLITLFLIKYPYNISIIKKLSKSKRLWQFNTLRGFIFCENVNVSSL